VGTNTGNTTLYHSTLTAKLVGSDTSACDAIDATLVPGETVTCDVTYVVLNADLYLTEKVLGVFASGISITSVSVTASSATGAEAWVTLAETGADEATQSRFAALFFAAGLFLLLLAHRYRREEDEL